MWIVIYTAGVLFAGALIGFGVSALLTSAKITDLESENWQLRWKMTLLENKLN